MSKIEFNANVRIYQGEFRRNVHGERSAALFDLQSAMPGGEARLDAISEEALRVILREYDGNSELTVSGNTALFPEYMRAGLSDIFADLKRAGMLDGFSLDMSRWSAVLTPAGLGYFDVKQKAPGGGAGLEKLPPVSEKLLLALAESDDPDKILWERYNNGSYDELRELSGILRELAGEGYIRIPVWKDDIPRHVEISDAARAYFDREAETISPDLSVSPAQKDELKQYDLFLSHAGRDRSVYADELYASLSRLGVSILYDRSVFPRGDGWKDKIIEGIGSSEFAILIISENFFEGEWTGMELNRLLRRKNPDGQKTVLPLLHRITPEDLYKKYPSLTGLHCLTTDRSNEEISLIFAKELIKRLKSFAAK